MRDGGTWVCACNNFLTGFGSPCPRGGKRAMGSPPFLFQDSWLESEIKGIKTQSCPATCLPLLSTKSSPTLVCWVWLDSVQPMDSRQSGHLALATELDVCPRAYVSINDFSTYTTNCIQFVWSFYIIVCMYVVVWTTFVRGQLCLNDVPTTGE